jgi:hypothetical protein
MDSAIPATRSFRYSTAGAGPVAILYSRSRPRSRRGFANSSTACQHVKPRSAAGSDRLRFGRNEQVCRGPDRGGRQIGAD